MRFRGKGLSYTAILFQKNSTQTSRAPAAIKKKKTKTKSTGRMKILCSLEWLVSHQLLPCLLYSSTQAKSPPSFIYMGHFGAPDYSPDCASDNRVPSHVVRDGFFDVK